MTSDELKALKEQWYKDAVQDGSIALCYFVGRQLGSDPAGRGYVSTYGPKYKWSSEGVEIYVDDYGGYMTVHNNGKQVCSTHYCSRLFVPGDWMNVVRQAAVKARQKKEGDEHRREQVECQRLMDELDIQDC